MTFSYFILNVYNVKIPNSFTHFYRYLCVWFQAVLNTYEKKSNIKFQKYTTIRQTINYMQIVRNDLAGI